MVLLLARSAWATTYYATTETFHDIQRNYAESGDTIELAEGTYYGAYYDSTWVTIYPDGENIIYTSEDPDDPDCVANTIISGRGWTDEQEPEFEAYERACQFVNGESSSCKLIGLTIMRGLIEDPLPCGGRITSEPAIYCDGASPTISKCRIIGGDCGMDVEGITCNDSSSLIEECEISAAEGSSQAVLIDGSSSVVIRDCTISDNTECTVTGGIYCSGTATVEITGCTISENEGARVGGIYSDSSGTVTVRDCEIVSNVTDAGYAGAFEISNGDAVIEDCTIADNDGGSQAGGICIGPGLDTIDVTNCEIVGNHGSNAGGIYCNSDADVVIENCKITENQGDYMAGGLECHGGLGSSLVVRNCVIEGNHGYYAGGATVDSLSAAVEHCTISDNYAENGVGGIEWASSGSLMITNCLIVGNHGADAGPGGLTAGGVLLPIGDISIRNCTIAENVSDADGGGIWIGCPLSPTWADIRNTIIWGNIACDSGNQIYNDYYYWPLADIGNCDIQDSDTDDVYVYDVVTDAILGNDEGGNIDADPEFVADGGWSGNCEDIGEWTAGDYHLTNNSTACIETGDDSVVDWDYDIDGEDRIMGDHVDIGADEYPYPLLIDDGYYDTIQDAIDAAVDGNVIILYPRVYYEKIDFDGKAITITGTDTCNWDVIGATVIQGGSGNGVKAVSQEGNDSVLTGVTVTGWTTGVYCNGGSSPTIARCIIEDNSNALLSYSGSCTNILENIIRNNSYTGIYGNGATNIVAKGNIISGNAYGISLQYCAPTIHNNTIVDNTTEGVKAQYANPNIKNCILWNDSDDLDGCTATYSCIKEGASGTNIDDDPELDEDYRLTADSPCIDTGDAIYDPDNEEIDIDCEARMANRYIDMGADEMSIFSDPNAHWWMFEQSTADLVGNSNGTLVNGAGYTSEGLFGYALTLDGTNDYMSVSSLDNAYLNDDTFSVCGWFKADSTSGTQTIVGQWRHFDPSGTGAAKIYFGWQVLVEDGHLKARFGAGLTPVDIDAGEVDADEWYHFALVYQTGYVDAVLYLDAVAGDPESGCYFAASNTKFRIGDGSYKDATFDPDYLKGGPFDGDIDDVMIFHRALSADEVEALYDSGL